MPQANLPPSLYRQFASLNDRVRKLESGGLGAAGVGATPVRYLNPREPVMWFGTGATGTLTVQAMLAGIHVWNVNATGNFYINIVGRTAVTSSPPNSGCSAVTFWDYLPKPQWQDVTPTGTLSSAVTLQIIIKQGSTPRNLLGVRIDGVLQYVRWTGTTGSYTLPPATANGYDHFWLEIMASPSDYYEYYITGSKSGG